MKCAMHKIWLPRFGPRNMDSLKTSEIQKFLASLIGPKEEGKIGRQTALKFKSYLSSIFSAAIRLEAGVIRNPVRSVRVVAEEPEKPRTYLTPEQAVAIEEKLTDHRHRSSGCASPTASCRMRSSPVSPISPSATAAATPM